MGEPSFDTSEFLKIKREVPDELPPPTDDFVDLDQHTTDYPFPVSVVKVNYIIFLREAVVRITDC